MKVSDVPPPVGTRAVLFWAGHHYGATFRGVSKKTGMWHFTSGEENFFLAPGSRWIVQYLAGGQSNCVGKTKETDSQLGP